MTLSYTNPIFLALIALVWYRQRLESGLLMCIGMGLANVSSVFSYFTVLFTGIGGYVFLNEKLDGISLVGCTIILASGILTMVLKESSTFSPHSRT